MAHGELNPFGAMMGSPAGLPSTASGTHFISRDAEPGNTLLVNIKAFLNENVTAF